MTETLSPPKIVLVGRPNVGKSSLFNRLVGKNLALVDDTPGLTRDRKIAAAELDGYMVEIIDSPGLEEAAKDSVAARMKSQTENAVRDADLILFVIDGRAGVTPIDEFYAAWLRGWQKPMLLVVNKCEGKGGQAGLLEAYSLGFGEPLDVSAAHNDNMNILKAVIVDTLKRHEKLVSAEDDEEIDDRVTGDDEEEDQTWRNKPLHLAIVGRPNAGKSTLVNALLGEDRMLTGPEAGLTRDSVHIPFSWPIDENSQREIRLVDTAGLRRRARVSDRLEKMAVHETLRTIRLAHVVVLMVDATQALDRQDLEIARHVVEEGRALVLAVNKWDLVREKAETKREIEANLASSFSQVKQLAVVTLSAIRDQGLKQLMDAVLNVEEQWNVRVSTGRFNRWLESALDANPPPLASGTRIKIRYGTQIKTRPPTFALFCNKPVDMPDSYMRYLSNSMREHFKLGGIPLRLQLKKPDNPYAS